MARIAAMVYGLVCYVVFFGAILYAIGFVGNLAVAKGIDSGTARPVRDAALVDVLLLGLFGLQHTVMARPAFKRAWTRLVPPPAERSTYVLLASGLLLLLFWPWRPMHSVVWDVRGPAAHALWALFGLGWATVLGATLMIGHFELFGVTQPWRYLRGLPPPPLRFRAPGLYRYCRHPIMLGFLVAFWATPRMTAGHALFSGVVTLYVLVAIQIEERDLLAAFGEEYRRYKRTTWALLPLPPGQEG